MHTSCTSCMRAYICHNIFVYLVPVEVMSKIFQWRFIVLDQKHFINTLPGQVTIWNVYPFSDTSIYKETLVTRDPRLCNWGGPKMGNARLSFKIFQVNGHFYGCYITFDGETRGDMGYPTPISANIQMNVNRRRQCCRCSAQGTLGTTKPRLDRGWIDPHISQKWSEPTTQRNITGDQHTT
jgi:hypothetical protein